LKIGYLNLRHLLVHYPYLKTAYNSILFCEVIPYFFQRIRVLSEEEKNDIFRTYSSLMSYFNPGAEGGGSRGVNSPPHLPRIFPVLRIFFFWKLLWPSSKTHEGANIFLRELSFKSPTMFCHFFYWIFNLKPVTKLKKMRLKTTLSLLIKMHRFVFNKTFVWIV
jgi:hypothetical protein